MSSWPRKAFLFASAHVQLAPEGVSVRICPCPAGLFRRFCLRRTERGWPLEAFLFVSVWGVHRLLRWVGNGGPPAPRRFFQFRIGAVSETDRPDKTGAAAEETGSPSQPGEGSRSGLRRRAVPSGLHVSVSGGRRPSSRPPGSGRATFVSTAKSVSRKRQRSRLAELTALPGKLPEKLSEGLERGLQVTANALRDPVGTVQQAVAALPVPKGLVLGWAIAMLLPIVLYLLDLGAGSLSSPDAEVALLVRRVLSGELPLDRALVVGSVSPSSGGPMGLIPFAAFGRLFGLGETALRLVPVLACLGAAFCLLAIAVDTGVGRNTGGLAALCLLAMPVCYQLSHRVVPDMFVALASAATVALVSHSLHGHKFDRHILPIHKATEEPEALPLRRLPMFFAAVGIGAAAVVDVRAGLVGLLFGFLDCVISHRDLLRKRRVWLMWLGGTVLLLLASRLHGGTLQQLFRRPEKEPFWLAFHAIWTQGQTVYGQHIGQVVVVMTCFGLLLGALRRASRPLLLWVMLATLLTLLGGDLAPPRGLGLVLPPLALAAAVGLQSPLRWLGRLGSLVPSVALFGVVLATLEGSEHLHQSDSIKALVQSLRHAPLSARRCVVGMPLAVPAYYSRQPIEHFDDVEAFSRSLARNELFSCLVPADLLPKLRAAVLPPADLRPKSQTPPPPGQPTSIETVLQTTLDVEEPPPDLTGPAVVLVSR